MELIVCVIGMLLAFYLGASMGKEKPITLNPIKIIEEKKESKQLEEEMKEENDYYNAIAENIDNYDGTGLFQKDLPR